MDSELLEGYTAEQLHERIQSHYSASTITQIIPTSPMMQDSRTGEFTRDYLILIKNCTTSIQI